MTKYKVNGGDKSERGDKVISPEVKWNPLRDERERNGYIQKCQIPSGNPTGC